MIENCSSRTIAKPRLEPSLKANTRRRDGASPQASVDSANGAHYVVIDAGPAGPVQTREATLTTHYHKADIPPDIELGDCVAIDTETMGLKPGRDRLCLMQLSSGDGDAHIVQFAAGHYDAPNLKAMLGDPTVTKLFHFARFDVAVIKAYLGLLCAPIYCTKIASKLARTYTDRHGLKDLCKELLDVDLSKQQQSSDWGASELSAAQLDYAAKDVLYLHRLAETLDGMLAREGRRDLAAACFAYLPARAELDLAGWADVDILAH